MKHRKKKSSKKIQQKNTQKKHSEPFDENKRKDVPSWELTYPIPRYVWRWFSFSPGGICSFPWRVFRNGDETPTKFATNHQNQNLYPSLMANESYGIQPWKTWISTCQQYPAAIRQLHDGHMTPWKAGTAYKIVGMFQRNEGQHICCCDGLVFLPHDRHSRLSRHDPTSISFDWSGGNKKHQHMMGHEKYQIILMKWLNGLDLYLLDHRSVLRTSLVQTSVAPCSRCRDQSKIAPRELPETKTCRMRWKGPAKTAKKTKRWILKSSKKNWYW